MGLTDHETDLDNFMERVSEHGLAYTLRRYYSTYRGRVIRNDEDTDDPASGLGRVQVQVLFAGHTAPVTEWVDPIFIGAAADRGFFWPPEVGDAVWVVFLEGNPSRPLCYLGSWFGAEELPTEFAYRSVGDRKIPQVRGFISRLGHKVIFTDVPGEEALEISWHQPATGDPALSDTAKSADRTRGKTASLKFQKDNSVLLVDSEGQSVLLDAGAKKLVLSDANNNTITMDNGGITFDSNKKIRLKAPSVAIDSNNVALCEGATTPFVKGTELATYLGTHVHALVSPPAPAPLLTGPPLPPPPVPAILSVKIKGG